MEEKVLTFNETHNLFKSGDTLFLAVSGGPDSLALLHFFASLQSSWNLQLHILTVDHQLRGQASKDDANFVYEQSLRLGLPCTIGTLDVKKYQKETQKGTQEAARNLRYQFFENEMNNFQHAKLVLGHHADDQLESIVMQIIKGVRQRGMPVQRKFGKHTLIRPFLSVTKEDIYQYIEKHQLNPRIDETNVDPTYTRNRIRKQIIPLLKKENPNLVHSLINMTEELNEEDEYLNALASKKLEEFSSFYEQKVTFSISRFKEYPLSLQRRFFHLILNYLQRSMNVDKDYFPLFREWLHSNKPNSELSFLNLTVNKSYDICEMIYGNIIKNSYEVNLHLDEQITLPNGWKVYVKEWNSNTVKGEHSFVCPKSKIVFPLTIRTRRDGDRIHPLGVNGTKKLKKVFIDQKIPTQDRDMLPIIINGDGQILWVPFVVKSQLANDNENPSIIITVER
ncbi:tRNA lysidine(34) synthetase TilS [Bacillaceae bacterium W0354]